MNNTLMRRLFAALIVVLGVTAVHSMASAQIRYTCIIVNGVKIIVIVNQNTATTSPGSNSSGTFNPVGPPPPPTGPVNVSYTPVNITVNSVDPVNGTVRTGLTPGAPQPLTTVISNGQERFPATSVIAFNADTRIGTNTYRSASALEFKSTNVQSLPPFKNVTFTLDKDVVFNQVDGSGTFTLKAGSTTVSF